MSVGIGFYSLCYIHVQQKTYRYYNLFNHSLDDHLSFFLIFAIMNFIAI